MRRRLFIGTIATLGVIPLATLFTSLSILFSSPDLVYAQTNNAPAFTDGESTTRSVDENTAAFSNIGAPVAATDSDSDDRLTYSIENASTKNFTIHQRTGQLQVGGPLDYETKNTYTITVKATDPSGDSDTIEVTINVIDVDEDGTVTLSWTKPQVGTEITATLTDPDNVSGTPTWQWSRSSSRTSTYTDINGATSAAYTPVTGSSGDRGKYLRATATYTDGESSTKTASARTATTVRTVPTNNNAPVFGDGQTGQYDCGDQDLTTFCMITRTSHPVEKNIYYPVKATDADSGDEIRYSLEGTHAADFYIEPIRGQLFTKTLPRELPANISRFTIKAEDQSGASDTISVKITRLGSGRSPVIVGPSRITYPENGTWPVAKYSASNANKDHPYNGSIGWIVSVNPGGGDGDFFRINDEGLLLFEQPPDYEEPLDYPYDEDDESDNTYSFSLTAYETNPPSGRSQESYFSVTVTVVNVDEALEILGPSAIDYPENSTDAVYTFTVSGSEGPVTWSPPSGTDGDNFAISETGTLTFISPPDYENPLDLDGGGRHKDQPDNGYLVAITVEDGTDIKTEHVKVRVTNVNEPPEFDADLATSFSVEADIGPDKQVGDPYTATDPDEAAFLTYSLSTNTLPFEIDQYNGQLSTKSTLTQFDRTSYTVTVLVTDNADDEGDADTATDDQITITINIVDGGSSNNAPEFPTAAVTFTVDENTSTVQDVGTPVTATDGDSDTLSYTLEGTDAGFFTIGSTSGQIQTKASQNYDFETKSIYSVTVKADDDNGGTATKAVTINLNNVEEGGTVTFLPTQPSARNQITASVTDLDGSVTVTGWQWAKADTQNGVYANINGETSAEYTPEDGDVDKFLQATASYNDGHGNGKSATAKTGAVQSGTNRAPTFDDGLTTTRDVEENTATGGNIGAAVEATDLDSDTLTYSLTGADASSFNIDSTGQIKVGSSTTLNFESAKKSYTVIAQVHDGKNASGGTDTTIDDTIVVTINVTNVEEAGTVTLSNTQPPARSEITAILSDPDGGVTSESWQWARTTDPTDLGNHPWTNITSATSASYTPVDGDMNYYLQAKVSYTDAEASGKSAKAETTQAVGAGANRAPTFASGTLTFTVNENSGADVDVGSPVTATDLDTGNRLTYTLEGTDKDSFKIVSDSGQIQTKASQNYDFETKSSYSVTVKADDGNNGGTATKAVTISLTNVEEAGTVSLSPTQPVARSVVTATLTDPDGSISGTSWQWQKSSDGTNNWNNVGTNSSSYTPPDADLTYYLRATATYTDGQGSGKTATAKTAAAVQSGTNRSPTFDEGLTTTREVAENSPATANVGAVVGASDLDDDSLIYSLTGQDAGLFTIGTSDGQVKVKTGTTLNYEGTRNSYTVIVQVHDDKDPSGSPDPAIDDVIVVTINVTNVDEDGTVSLSMTHPSARTQLTATLTDPDGGVTNESWQWARTTDPTDLGNHPWTNITSATSASYTPDDGDINYYLQATVSYTDAEASGKSAKVKTTQAVGAAANRAPTFASGAVTRTVAENSGADVDVGNPVTATDLDTSNTLTYTLEGTDKDSFTIAPGTGQIQTKSGETYDYETKSSYSVTVKADDNNGGTATKPVTITLTNVEEAGTVRLAPAQPAARSPVTATLTDPDGSISGTSWEWQRSSDGNAPWTDVGTNSDTYTPVDGDATYYLRATVSYTDGQGGSKTATATTTQQVQTGTNRPPTFTDGRTTSRDVAENTAANGDVGAAVGATDQDNDSLTYSLTSTDASLFTVDNTGQIKVGASTTLDYESAKNTYTVVVQVTDSKDPAGNTETRPTIDDIIVVTINVTDVEETGTVSFSTTHPKARTQFTATLTDPDGGVTGTTWVWARADAQDGAYTTIAGETSANYTPTDGDQEKFLKATATYEDRRGTGKTAGAVSDNAVGTGTNRTPEFDGTATTREFPENTGPGLPVGTPVGATDADINDVLKYTLDGTDKDSFEIVSTNGQLKTKDGVTYNHEAKDSYSVTVKADDKNGGTDTIAVTINVTDVNEKPAFDATPPVTFSIAENSSANTNIGTAVGATDPDDGDTLFYSLDSDSASIFNIDSSNGQLRTKAALDKETKDTYTVTVSVRDNRDASGDDDTENDASIDVTVNVTDVNEPPEFPSTETRTRNVQEGTAANQAIGNPVKAVDPDVGATLTYTLGGTDAVSFNFDTATGQLKTKVALNKETKDTYTVTVSVTDGKADDGTTDNAADDIITVTIKVTDSNEPPVLSGSAAVDYEENGTGPVSTYTAIDPEGATIDWSLKGTDASAFTIDGGVLAFKDSPDYEDSSNTDKQYTVTVVATDNTNPVEQAVTVTITDANDPPSFDTATESRTVNENTLPGEDVGLPVSANDVDSGDTLTYSLGGEDSAYFGINSSTGQITVGAGIGLDFETRSRYVVTVTATDTSLASATITVTIEVNNVDEPGTVTLSQSQPQVDTPLVATLDDPDGDLVSSTTWKWEISDDGSNNWTAIAGETDADYTPASTDVGKYLRVTASYDDGHNTGKTAQAAPPNAVRDVPATNEAPEFPSSEMGARSIAENTAAGENVGAAVAATDGNSGDTLTYTLGGVDEPSFTIVSSSGQIQTKAALDHETKSTYTVTVTATDPSRETVTITVTITVTDVNEPPLAPGTPAMTRSSQTSLTMAWTAPSNAGRPAVTDYDYRYKKETETNWTEVTNTPITDTSVEITGLEVTTYYGVQVQARNDEGTGDWSLTGIGVTRTSPNAAPAFPTQTTTRHVRETAQAQENIGNPVDAQDTDNDDLTYILEGSDANSFMIDEDTGQLKTVMPLDHETKDSYSVMVKAVDGQGGSDSISVNINVLDVNEPPEFSGKLGVHSVAEDAGSGVDIGAPVTATDPENDTLTYSLDSAGAQVFAINASTGQLRTKAALDYESARTHSVMVHVSDRKDAAGNADTVVDDTISVTITVTDINESPAFTEGAPARVADEDSVIGTNIGDPVTATDPESDTLTYSLGGADAASFSIDTSSGQLKTGTALDFESGQRRYKVTVSVSDGKNADGNNDSAIDATVTVTIAVTDVDEPPAVAIRSTVRYAENGTGPVDTYTAADPESGTITWDLSGTDVDDFRIRKVNNEGVLEFRTPPNYEAPADADTNNVYLVTVEVSDGTNTDNLNVAVTVFNVNEPPAFPAETGSRSIDENTAANQNVGGAVAATDPEGHTLIYKLAGTDAASFAIDTSTGQLKTKAPLDYETKSTYLVTVHVHDSLDQDNRVNAVTDDTINITITINNVDEPGRIEFSSRQPQAATPFTATVIDLDDGVTGATWKWERSPDKGAWTTITGETSASYTPDATDDDGKYLRVTASYTDGEGPGKRAVGISDNQVRGTPANNDAPEFASTTATRAVDEGTAAGQPIGPPVAATDPDPDDANLLTYSMTGSDAASFAINRATGQLLTKAPLDHETKDRYSVTVKVVDPSLESDTIEVTITVNDVDEPPRLSGPGVVDYPENGADAVARYTATDPEGVTITDWSLDGDDKDLFEIGYAGELTFKSSPDHDIAGDNDGNNIYLVTVKASDGTNSVTLPVEITVSNVNEAPVFPDTEDGARTVAENTAADQDIGDPVAATDPDSGDTLTYTLGGADSSSFGIDETTGQLKTKAGVTYDHEVKDTYEVTVTATDSSGLSATITVTIAISSVNEPPEFTDGATASRSIAENTPAMQNIGTPVAASDPEDDTLSYALGGDDAASFSIDEATGQLKTWDPLDYETKSSYSVTVSVSDGKDIDGNADTTVDNTIGVTITVTDQNEDGRVILSSLQPQVDRALTATLVYPDDATNVSWTWAKSTDLSIWTAITTATSDTYTPATGDLNNYLRATATFTNSQNTQVSAHGISAYPVRAAPANNAAPAFAAATATRSIAEDAPVGSVVGDPVTATDTDAGDVLTYTLSGADADSFTIGMASGQLRTKVTLDHDTKPSYTVVVTATDPSGLSDTITVTITVTDANEPPVISGKTSVYYAEDRTDAVATYTATDPENVQITWTLAGDDSGDFLINATGVLTFSAQPDRETPADADANNIYLVTVQASDGTNTVPLDVTVTVTDAADPPLAPDAPTVEAAATDGHTALSVSWRAPAVSNSSPITGYEVEYRKQGAEDWSSENVTINGVTADITNVLPDTVYEVQVRAENADGWGAWSEQGTGRTDVTPLDQQVDLTVSYQAAGYTVNEGATANVSVTLSAAADRVLQIPITATLTTAESGDYQLNGLTSEALAFVPGDSSKSFTFQGLQDTDTDDETVTLGFGQSLPDKVTAGDRTTSVVTIDDDDAAVPRRPRSNRGGGGGGGGGSGGNYQGWPSSTNKAPTFTEGDSASRSVAENTAAGVNIGKPVRATDADNDTLTYTVGGDDGSSFSVDEDTGQLKTKSALDFERKSSYRVTMGVFDPNGGSDTITVTITVTDVTDVPLASGSTQIMGVVDSEADTTVSPLDGSVAVTFPSGSRSGDYQVRLDYGLTNCDLSISGEQLWFCLTVDIFDNEGNQEQGVVLSQAATIKITRNADERGGVDAVLELHEQGGVNVYTRGRTGGEWTGQAFTLESDGVGGIVITITGVSSFGLYAGTTDSLVPTQVSHQTTTTTTFQGTEGQGSTPEPTPNPTPTPTPAGQPSPTPEPTATPEPTVTPGQNTVPEPTSGHQMSSPLGPLGGPEATPTPVPTPSGIAKALGNLPLSPPQSGNLAPTAEPEVKIASFDSEDGEYAEMPSWYIALIMLGVAASIAGGGTYYMKRRRRLPEPITVRRSREFNKW